MSSKLIKTDETYRGWIWEVSSRFRRSQIKAAVKVNDEMLRFYWSLGHDMEAQKDAYAWGSHFYKTISEDLQAELPDVKSFSPRNLLYMHQFYRLFPEAGIAPRPGAQLDNGAITKQLVSQLPDVEIAQQDVSQMPAADEVFRIPWGHMI